MPAAINAILSFSVLSSLVQACYAALAVRRVKFLAACEPPADFKFPPLTVITPARDEGETILEASRSKLDCDYPGLELILVDDRSADDTGRIIDGLASEAGRAVPPPAVPEMPRVTRHSGGVVKALHVKNLPENWLGKVNAMQEGFKAASGEWLLFSDADVVFSGEALKKAVYFAETNGLGHLAVMPDLVSGGFALDAVFSAGVLPMLRWSSWSSGASRPAQAVGIGAFNLVRRSAFLKTPGFDWLKLELIDDMGLALMMRRSGAKGASISGRGLLKLRFYKTLADAARGAGKTALSGAEFSLTLLGSAAALLFVSEALPFLLVFYPGAPGPAVAAVCALKLFFYACCSAWNGRPVLPALLSPLGAAAAGMIMFKYAVSNALSGFVTWRGTAYPVGLLKAHKRFHLRNFY